MKKTKKIVAMILSTVMILSLGACGSEDKALETEVNDQRYETEEATTETRTYTTADSENSTSKSERSSSDEVLVYTSEDTYGGMINEPTLAGESYEEVAENKMVDTLRENTSTFSIDVDTASYSNIRRMLNDGYQPNPDAVRIEEMINYFDYEYPTPTDGLPFSITTSTTVCPWNEDNLVTMIGLSGMEIDNEDIPPSNIVMLIDVSGSMNSDDKLPLLKEAFKNLTENFTSQDRVSIVVYAGAAGVILEGEKGSNYREIEGALDSLSAGGSTAGGEGIELAYDIASDNFIKGGNNRVILATDGDFNVGMTSNTALERYIEEKREEDIFLSVIGFGTGNIKDDTMELLADKGNGNYAYIDSYDEAVKVFTKEFSGTMFTIAKDVKIQVEFNEDIIAGYRLIGYENRVMDNQDFENDRKDAGDLGAGHQVSALYELELVDPDKRITESMYEVKLRYKEPDSDKSEGIQVVEKLHEIYMDPYDDMNMLWALSVAEFGMILKDSPYQGYSSLIRVLDQAEYCADRTNDEYKEEFVHLVDDYLYDYGDETANSDDYEVIYID